MRHSSATNARCGSTAGLPPAAAVAAWRVRKVWVHEVMPHTMFLSPITRFFISTRQSATARRAHEDQHPRALHARTHEGRQRQRQPQPQQQRHHRCRAVDGRRYGGEGHVPLMDASVRAWERFLF